jgi:tRNA-Thr(GGU) m(6)t(6)A37 methyltransferase TsaA
MRGHTIVVIMEEITLKPIGVAKNSENKSRFGSFDGVVSEIIVDERFTDALNGTEDYSHVIVVYWMDKIKDYVITHRPQGNPEVPIIGIFACRCPPRPNPIGVTTVKLIERTGNRIKVKGLDILDGTPIIDIKPYWPVYDKVKDEKIPGWVNKLDI